MQPCLEISALNETGEAAEIIVYNRESQQPKGINNFMMAESQGGIAVSPLKIDSGSTDLQEK